MCYRSEASCDWNKVLLSKSEGLTVHCNGDRVQASRQMSEVSSGETRQSFQGAGWLPIRRVQRGRLSVRTVYCI